MPLIKNNKEPLSGKNSRPSILSILSKIMEGMFLNKLVCILV